MVAVIGSWLFFREPKMPGLHRSKRLYSWSVMNGRRARQFGARKLSDALTVLALPAIARNQQLFRAVFKHAPSNILIFPSNLCNALCSFCAYPTNIDPKMSMSDDIARKVIDDLIDLGGGEQICFTPNLGDPLVDPTLGTKLAYAKSRGVKHTYFYTNGILLDRDGLIESIAPHLDEILISLPGLDRENYKSVFKVDKAQKVGRGLLKLAEHRRRTGNPKRVVLEFRVDRPMSVVWRDEGLIALKTYIDDGTITIGSVVEEFDNWGGTIKESDLTGTMKMKEFKAKRDTPCAMLFKNPGVLPDGSVRACSCWYVSTNYDGLTLENVKDKPLGEILFGEQHRQIVVDWLSKSLPPPCGDCSYYTPLQLSLKDTIKAINGSDQS